MSTISSQLLVSASSVTEDFYKAFFRRGASAKELLIVSRLSVILVAMVAMGLSLSPKDTILDLVGHAWAGFGSAFGPLVLLSLLWKRTTQKGAVAGILVGGLTVLLWIYLDHPYKEVYAMIPGFFLSLVSIVTVSKLTIVPSIAIQEEFDAVKQDLKENY